MPVIHPARILVGTASWTDKDLIASKAFYPPGCNTAEARLRYYATRFPLVEVDSSYYAMPSVRNSELWSQRTPDGFTMNMKAFRLFTGHQTPLGMLPRDLQPLASPASQAQVYYLRTPPEVRDELWRRFHLALAPLRQSGRLGLVHFQFAPWVTCSREGRAHVAHCVERMREDTLSVEFRHESWFRDDQRESTLAFERELGVVHTVVDGPQGFSNSVPAVWAATHPSHALLRLHGRNVERWNLPGQGSAGERFNYDYRDDELGDLLPPLEKLAQDVATLHVVFNNTPEGRGQRNAQTLQDLLAQIPTAGGGV